MRCFRSTSQSSSPSSINRAMAKKKTDHETQQMIVLHRMCAQGKANYKKKALKAREKQLLRRKQRLNKRSLTTHVFMAAPKRLWKTDKLNTRRSLRTGVRPKAKQSRQGLNRRRSLIRKAVKAKQTHRLKARRSLNTQVLIKANQITWFLWKTYSCQ